MARQVLLPDVPNWSWHEYGMPVGVWRFFKLYERLGILPTLSINARVCHPYISGQPHRIKYLEKFYEYVADRSGVLHWNGEQLLGWYRGQTAG